MNVEDVNYVISFIKNHCPWVDVSPEGIESVREMSACQIYIKDKKFREEHKNTTFEPVFKTPLTVRKIDKAWIDDVPF